MNACWKVTLKLTITMIFLIPLLISCVGGITTALSDTILNQNDPGIVRDGAPAYIILMDALISRDPNDEDKLLAGSKLYGAYVSAFVNDPERSKRLAMRAYQYAKRSICLQLEEICKTSAGTLDQYQYALNRLNDEDDLPYLYGFASAWAGWVQVNSSDWSAIADLPKIEASIRKVIEINDRYDNGNAYLYLAVLNTQLPAGLGGKPEVGRKYFERAIEISEGKNLMAKLLFAKQYARLVFDKVLHDQLLNEVITVEPEVSGFTLTNTLAQQQAKVLLAESDDYF